MFNLHIIFIAYLIFASFMVNAAADNTETDFHNGFLVPSQSERPVADLPDHSVELVYDGEKGTCSITITEANPGKCILQIRRTNPTFEFTDEEDVSIEFFRKLVKDAYYDSKRGTYTKASNQDRDYIPQAYSARLSEWDQSKSTQIINETKEVRKVLVSEGTKILEERITRYCFTQGGRSSKVIRAEKEKHKKRCRELELQAARRKSIGYQSSPLTPWEKEELTHFSWFEILYDEFTHRRSCE